MSTLVELLAPGQPAFTSEVQQGDYVVEQVLGANEPTARHVMAKFQIYRASYVKPAANTPLTIAIDGVSTTAYFDVDDSFTDLRGGLCEFTRHWYTLPATWSEPGGTFAFTFPAYISPIAFGTTYNVTGVSANSNYYDVLSNAAGISAADTFLLDLNYVRSNQNYHVTFQADAKFSGDGTRVPIAKVLPGDGAFSGVTGTLREVAIGRTLPETLEVDSFLLHEYALADETTVDVLLPQVDKFSPVNSSAVEVDTLSTGTATTPNSATYSSMVANGVKIVARRSDRSKYAGNIYERITPLVNAR